MFNFLKKKLENLQPENKKITIIMLSAACCVPGMANFDERAKQVIELALKETGGDAEIKLIPATQAFFNSSLRKVINELMLMTNQGKLGTPAILINGEVVSFGVPTLEIMKDALNKFKEK